MENLYSFQDPLIRVGGWAKVRPSEMLLLKAEVNYTRIFTNDGSTFLVALTLKALEKRLEGFTFFRPHKSFLVNQKYVLNYTKISDETFILLTNGFKISVSRRKKADMMKMF